MMDRVGGGWKNKVVWCEESSSRVTCSRPIFSPTIGAFRSQLGKDTKPSGSQDYLRKNALPSALNAEGLLLHVLKNGKPSIISATRATQLPYPVHHTETPSTDSRQNKPLCSINLWTAAQGCRSAVGAPRKNCQIRVLGTRFLDEEVSHVDDKTGAPLLFMYYKLSVSGRLESFVYWAYGLDWW